MYIFAFIIIFATLCTQVNSKCETYLVSSVNLTDCNDRYCNLVSRYTFKSRASDGTQLCLSDAKSASNLDFPDVSVNFFNTHITYQLINCYSSDDPYITFNAFCGCPSGTSVDCQNCNLLPDYSLPNIRLCGTHSGSDCLLSGAGTFCGNVMFSGTKRYNICKIGKSSTFMEVYYNTTTDTQNSTVSFDSDVELILGTAKIRITKHYNQQPFYNHYMVQDTLNDRGFLIMPPNLVNSIDSFDYNQIGWFRTDFNFITPSTKNGFNLYVKSCKNDSFTMGVQAKKISFHFESGMYDNSIISSGSTLFMPDTPIIQDTTPVKAAELVPITSGKYWYDINNNPQPFGLLNSVLPYEQQEIRNITITYFGGVKAVSGNSLCGPWITVYNNPNTEGNSVPESYSLSLCQNPTVQSQFGLCTRHYTPRNGMSIENCVNPAFRGYYYPTHALVFAQFTKSGYSYSEVYEYKDNAPLLLTETGNELFDVTVETTQSNYKFESSSTYPLITNVDTHNNDYLIVTAHSTSSPGNCLMSFNQDILPITEVNLNEIDKDFKIPFQKNLFSGKVVITLTCYRNSDSVTVYLDINKKSDSIDFDVNPVKDTRELTLASRSSKWWWILSFMPQYLIPMLIFNAFKSTDSTTPLYGYNLTWFITGSIITVAFILFLIYYPMKMLYNRMMSMQDKRKSYKNKYY